ncbi:MAG: phage terminase large subunit [Candidatus Omnitrophica bacterium]|nr:phage terminase large subunit [Candidatus Omnitrophota bacterium]
MMITLNNKVSQIRREMSKDFAFFRRYYFPGYNTICDASFHRELVELLQGITNRRGEKLAIAAPRGSAKSTVVSLQYVLYCICHKLEEFIVLISSTSDQAALLLKHIKDELETNERLIQDFPDVCESGTKPKPPRWTQSEIITRNGIKVLTLGTGQKVRGRRNKQFRPTFILFDDVENDENAQSPDSYYKLDSWVTKSVLKAGSSRTNVVFIGTIHHYNSLLAKFTSDKENPGWIKCIYRSVISWSQHPELWEQWVKIFNNHAEYEGEAGKEAALNFYRENELDMLEGTEVLWPASKDYYDLMVLREEDGHASFDSEMQNEPINPKDCHFNLDDAHYWDDQFDSDEDLIRIFCDDFTVLGSCDPSMGKKHKGRDYSAIITVVKHNATGKMYVLDADIEKRLPDKTIEHILEHHRRRKYDKFGFESNQFQEFMADELEKRSAKSGGYIPLEKINHTTDKQARIEALQPLVKNGTIQFSRKHRTLLEQMKYFPKGRHDDGLDALEMVVQLARSSGGAVIFTSDGTYDVFPSSW